MSYLSRIGTDHEIKSRTRNAKVGISRGGKLLVDGLVSYFWFHCKHISYISNFDYDIILNLSIFKGPNSLLVVKIIE